MKITPYLSFNGDCEQAFKFYEETLKGKITFMSKMGDSPMAAQFPKDANKIMHASLSVGDEVLAGADMCGGGDYQKPQGMNVSLSPTSVKDAEQIYQALAEGGTVQMELQETFWAQRFAMLTDRFGVRWMINCEKSFA